MTFDDFNLDKCADGLLPVIVQDSVTLRVLMLGTFSMLSTCIPTATMTPY